MNNSLSARRQGLIKKSVRIIELLAPKSDVVNRKLFSLKNLSSILSNLKKNNKKKTMRTASKAKTS